MTIVFIGATARRQPLVAALACAFTACGGGGRSRSGGDDANAETAGGGSGSTLDSSVDGSGDADAFPKADGFGADAGVCPISDNDAGTCNAVAPLGPFVTAMCSAAEPPQAQGGTIEDGTYVLDAFTYYGGCMPQDVSTTTWVVCGGHWDAAERFPPIGGTTLPVEHISTIATVNGTTVNLATICVSAGSAFGGFAPRGFTARTGHLMFIYPVASGTLVSTYSKQ